MRRPRLLMWPVVFGGGRVFDEDLAVVVDEDYGLLIPEDMDVLASQGVVDLVEAPFDVDLSHFLDLPDLIAGPSDLRARGQRHRPLHDPSTT